VRYNQGLTTTLLEMIMSKQASQASPTFLEQCEAVCSKVSRQVARDELRSQQESDWRHMVREQLKCAAGLTHEMFPQLVRF
jgi:hypothetical protein